MTASPEFFKGKSRTELKAFFTHAAGFLIDRIGRDNFISAVVHMDEKTPHMHLVFVPLTEDKRLCAKEIIGNRKKLIAWQDDFWTHMVKKYPDLERGESAGETGRDHIPTRVFKEMAHLNRQRVKLDELLSGLSAFNIKAKSSEITALLDKYIPGVEKMSTQLKKYKGAFTQLADENNALAAKNEQLTEQSKESIMKKLGQAQLERDLDEALATLESIPPKVLEQFRQSGRPEASHER